MNEGKDTHTVAHSHKHPDEMEFEAAHAHTSRATPNITGAPEVKRPHIKWKRHRRANSCALTTERSQGLEPVVSCLAHSPRGERDILLIWATSDRSACLFWRQNKRQRGASGGGKKRTLARLRQESTPKGALGFCSLAFSFSQSASACSPVCVRVVHK